MRLQDYFLPAIGAGGSLAPATTGSTVPGCWSELEPEQQATPPLCSPWRRFVLKLRRLALKRRCLTYLGHWLCDVKRGVRQQREL